jgi:hypothetical protein
MMRLDGCEAKKGVGNGNDYLGWFKSAIQASCLVGGKRGIGMCEVELLGSLGASGNIAVDYDGMLWIYIG